MVLVDDDDNGSDKILMLGVKMITIIDEIFELLLVEFFTNFFFEIF